MSVGGISGGGGHIGAASSTRTANTLSNVGSAAFNTLVTAGSVAAGAIGGPAAAGAVGSLRGLGGSGGGFGGTAGSGGEIAQATGEIQAQNKTNLGSAASENRESQAFQVDLFRLQNSINMQSQTNNMITNMQKARHDAAMAAIQNVR